MLLIGFVFDMMLEVTLVRTGLYIYSQVIPFGSLFVGDTFQFPLIWESLSVTFVMIPAGLLVYRDDTGKSVAEKLAAKAKLFPKKPVLGMFVVMFVIINLAYFAYGGGFAAIKASGPATSVACPWPYPEAKVYDPQGFYEKNGAEGRTRSGSGPPGCSAQPDGRPDVEPPPPAIGVRTRKPEWLKRAASSSPEPHAASGWPPRRFLYKRGWRSSRRCGRSTRAWRACARRPVRVTTTRG